MTLGSNKANLRVVTEPNGLRNLDAICASDGLRYEVMPG